MALTPWRVRAPIPQSVSRIVLGPPPAAVDNSLLMGRTSELTPNGGVPVWLAHGKEQVVAVVGKRGSGKTFTLGVIVEGLCAKQQRTVICNNDDPRAVIVFDPLDNYWTLRFPIARGENPELSQLYESAERQNLIGIDFNVECWLPGAANSRPTDPPWFRTLAIKPRNLKPEDWELLLGVSLVREPMGQALVDAIRLASETGYQCAGQQVGPRADFALADLIHAVDADANQSTYHSETLRAVRQRLQYLDTLGLFHPTGTSIRELAIRGTASIVLLNRVQEGVREVIIAVIIRALMADRSEVAGVRRRLAVDNTLGTDEVKCLTEFAAQSTPKTTVILDEAQNFLSPEQSGPSKEIFTKLVKEGRNFGLSAVLATQQPSAIDRRLLSQVEAFVAHSLVTEADIKSVRDNLKSDTPDNIQYSQEELDFGSALRRLEPGQCVVSASNNSIGNFNRVFFINVRARATMHGGMEL